MKPNRTTNCCQLLNSIMPDSDYVQSKEATLERGIVHSYLCHVIWIIITFHHTKSGYLHVLLVIVITITTSPHWLLHVLPSSPLHEYFMNQSHDSVEGLYEKTSKISPYGLYKGLKSRFVITGTFKNLCHRHILVLQWIMLL